MRKDMASDAAEMLEAAGCKNVSTYDRGSFPGMAIHEMGTARMGKNPKESVLNEWNQVHACKNVFVTDAACMRSEEHTSELQSLMRNSYAVFCLKKKKKQKYTSDDSDT